MTIQHNIQLKCIVTVKISNHLTRKPLSRSHDIEADAHSDVHTDLHNIIVMEVLQQLYRCYM